MLSNYNQINTTYKKNYEEKEFNRFEKTIFNQKKINFSDYNLETETDENLISLANYCEIYKYDKQLEIILTKLIERNNPSGSIKLGNYYLFNKNYNEAIYCYTIAYEKFDNKNAGLNLALSYSYIKNYDKAQKICWNYINKKDADAVYFMVIISTGVKKCNLLNMLYLFLGLKYSSTRCEKLFDNYFNSGIKLCKILSELQKHKITSDLIEKKINKNKINEKDLKNCKIDTYFEEIFSFINTYNLEMFAQLSLSVQNSFLENDKTSDELKDTYEAYSIVNLLLR